MKTKQDIHDIWSVDIAEGLVSGYVTRSKGRYLVKVSPAGAVSYLKHEQASVSLSEDKISESEQELVAREVVQSHFHLAYSGNACVTVSCIATKSKDAIPSKGPDSFVRGIPVWELEAQ